MPVRLINAVAPTRICDIGGWTDTWFAESGAVFNLAISPHAEVQVAVGGRTRDPAVTLAVENFGDRYDFDPDAPPGRHPLLEATVAHVGVPQGTEVEITLHSDMPPGSSTGTSAAIVVALVGALAAVQGRRIPSAEIARLAHEVEVERLGLQSGVQDQLAAAFGGANFIEINRYPHTAVTPLDLAEDVWWELQRRLVVVFLGRRHVSSEIHEKVIADVLGDGATATAATTLGTLRRLARDARDAIVRGDLDALGDIMCRNTEAQAALHPDLVSATAQELTAVARDAGARGWKVNGAGGDGGSLTFLSGPTLLARRQLVDAVEAFGPGVRVLPTRLSRGGLRVWESRAAVDR